MTNIDIVNSLSKEEFDKFYFQQHLPVIHKGGAQKTKYFTKWSTDYLKKKVNSKIVKVNHCENGVFDFNKHKIEKLEIPFVDAVNVFCSEQHNNRSYYLQQTPIEDILSELVDDFEISQWNLSYDLLGKPNLWMGGAGCVSPLHYDTKNNFLTQIQGRKELTLFSPSDTIYLYPSSRGAHHLSEINLDSPDINKFPLYPLAQPIHCILEPGDILFIPTGWWHHVRSLDMSISINCWWDRFDIVEGIGIEAFDVQHIAATGQNFLAVGIDINQRKIDGEPLLLKAIKIGYANVVEALLSLGADANLISSIYSPGSSALDFALQRGSNEIVQLLLKYGAKTNSVAN